MTDAELRSVMEEAFNAGMEYAGAEGGYIMGEGANTVDFETWFASWHADPGRAPSGG